MDKYEKPHVRRYHDFELKQPLSRESVINAGEQVRVFEAGAGYFRLQQIMEAERARMHGILYSRNPESVNEAKVHFAMGVVQALDGIYDALNKILLEAQEQREQ